MSKAIADIKDKIVAQARLLAPFDGWTADMLAQAAVECGEKPQMASALFPGGIADALAHHAGMADRDMLAVLTRDIPDVETLRIRDRIRAGVMTRFEILLPLREAERRALNYWTVPLRSIKGARILWRTADAIWNWAGDTAQDYNHYTKRALLSGVIGSATLVWIDDRSPDLSDTASFVDRRIENVMQLGRTVGRFRKAA